MMSRREEVSDELHGAYDDLHTGLRLLEEVAANAGGGLLPEDGAAPVPV